MSRDDFNLVPQVTVLVQLAGLSEVDSSMIYMDDMDLDACQVSLPRALSVFPASSKLQRRIALPTIKSPLVMTLG